MRESLTISKEGMVTVGVRKALYAPVMSASDTVDAASGNLRMTIAAVATTTKLATKPQVNAGSFDFDKGPASAFAGILPTNGRIRSVDGVHANAAHVSRYWRNALR